MSHVKFRWTGLDEFKAQLRELPERLRGEATHIVEGAANGAAVAIRTGYGQHRHTGNLQESVVVLHQHSKFGARSVVLVAAPHAHLFEWGTQARKRNSGGETGAMWSKTPPVFTFTRTIVPERRRMYGDIADMMRREGLEVRGDA